MDIKVGDLERSMISDFAEAQDSPSSMKRGFLCSGPQWTFRVAFPFLGSVVTCSPTCEAFAAHPDRSKELINYALNSCRRIVVCTFWWTKGRWRWEMKSLQAGEQIPASHSCLLFLWDFFWFCFTVLAPPSQPPLPPKSPTTLHLRVQERVPHHRTGYRVFCNVISHE